ncbi:MAG TPA: hypothetical protein VJ974_05990 [Geopsychrobacteraceae bacterium]|nr:hypothetical protein [Geopsychrobacteraceae bacterium]
MAITGSPKKMAQDIADAYSSLSPPMLKKYTPADLKIIMNSLAQVKREIRQVQVPLDNVMLVKAKNMKLSRLNQAETVVRSYCKKKRIPI